MIIGGHKMREQFSVISTVVLFTGIFTAGMAPLRATAIEIQSQDVRLPGPGRAYTGVGAKMLNRHCSLCHSPTFVDTQPALSAGTWKAEVMKMKEAFGAPIDPSVVPDLVNVLMERHGKPEGDQMTAPDAPGASG